MMMGSSQIGSDPHELELLSRIGKHVVPLHDLTTREFLSAGMFQRELADMSQTNIQPDTFGVITASVTSVADTVSSHVG